VTTETPETLGKEGRDFGSSESVSWEFVNGLNEEMGFHLEGRARKVEIEHKDITIHKVRGNINVTTLKGFFLTLHHKLSSDT